jgi:hypothetical protein
MMSLPYTLIAIFIALQVGIPTLSAQDGSALPSGKDEKEQERVRFNGLGRTILSQTAIDGPILESDTNTIRQLVDGEFLLDLQVNATPNKKTEIQSILRLRNEFGGFFGAGMSIEVRELWARGIIANRINYRVGDMDVAMTPYTFFNWDEEGRVNEAAAFSPYREILHYEQFYQSGNTRRVQGGKLDFGLRFTDIIRDIDFTSFAAIVRGTDFFTIPSRYTSGGQMNLSTYTLHDSLGIKADVGFNLVHTFDNLQSGLANIGIRNTVYSINWDVTALKTNNIEVHLLGEGGRSSLANNDSINLYEIEDSFIDVGTKIIFKPAKLTFYAAFVDVGPDFFSIAAQSRRINFQAEKSYYDRIGVDAAFRAPSLFDITRDRALYTFELSDRLMPYDPRFSNTLPYGTATPNRRGFRFGLEHGGDKDKIEARLDAALMNEIRGQGTFELKQFTLVRAAANINIHQFIQWKNKLRITLGYQYENTTRNGVEVEQVDLQSNLIDLGLEIELFKNFEIIAGAKLLQAKGREYLPRINRFNEVIDFPSAYIADDRETLIASGIKYTFKKGVYLTIQYQSFQSQKGANNPNDFNFNQFFAIYNMNF